MLHTWVEQRFVETGCEWDGPRPVLHVLQNDHYAEVALRMVEVEDYDCVREVFVNASMALPPRSTVVGLGD